MIKFASRLAKLEDIVFADEKTRLDFWRSMVTWVYWNHSLSDGGEWEAAFDALPQYHPVRMAHDTLRTYRGQFDEVLTAEKDKLWERRVEIAFYAVIMAGIEDLKLTPAELFPVEEMREAIEVVNRILNDREWWEEFYQKEEEHNQAMKHNTAETFTRPVLQVPPPTETPAERQERLAARLEELHYEPPPPLDDPPPTVVGGPVTLTYQGGQRGFQVRTIDGIKSIEPGDTVILPSEVWANIQAGPTPSAWWVLV